MTSVPDNNRRPMVVFCLYFHLASFISVLKLNLQSVQMREESSLCLFFTSILYIYKGGLIINELLKQTLIFHKWHKHKTKTASQQQQKERKVWREKESKRGGCESHFEKVPLSGNWISFSFTYPGQNISEWCTILPIKEWWTVLLNWRLFSRLSELIVFVQ